MKISNYMNNTNLIVEKNNVKVQKENKQTNEKHTTEQSVKLSISNEGKIIGLLKERGFATFGRENNNCNKFIFIDF